MSLYKLIQKEIKEYKALGRTYRGVPVKASLGADSGAVIGACAHSPYEDSIGQLMFYWGFIRLRLTFCNKASGIFGEHTSF